MALLNRKLLILAKIEVTYGTDVLPAGADAILVTNASLSPLEAEVIDRDFVRSYLGASGKIMAGEHAKLEFSVELAGAGAAGTAPKWGRLVRACAMSETITAGVDVQYLPVSSAFESLTIYVNLDGQLHKLTGCRGSFSIETEVNKIPLLKFSFLGLYNAPTSTAAPTPDFTGFIAPTPATKAHVSGFGLQGWAGEVLKLSADLGMNVVFHQTMSSGEMIMTERQAKGSLSAEAPDLTTKNWFTTALANTTGALTIQYGQTAGNIVKLDAPNAQAISPKYGDTNGIATLDMDLAFIPGASGNDEFKITVK
jgi:hypothetical protein